MSGAKTKGEGESPLQAGGAGPRPLSAREREILGLIAEGQSGAAIAKDLVLSPETVRTHVRNAMDKLGASTRSQAVALALEGGEIGDGRPPTAAQPATSAITVEAGAGPMLTALLAGVVSLADVESGAIYFAEDGGMLLRIAAHASSGSAPSAAPASELTLGDSGIGRVALERRAQLIASSHVGADANACPTLASPMTAGGKLTGVLALGIRHARPIRRRELLLIEAFANRIAEVLVTGADPAALRLALQRFRASWTETLDGA